jgi:hypothetical protein
VRGVAPLSLKIAAELFHAHEPCVFMAFPDSEPKLQRMPTEASGAHGVATADVSAHAGRLQTQLPTRSSVCCGYYTRATVRRGTTRSTTDIGCARDMRETMPERRTSCPALALHPPKPPSGLEAYTIAARYPCTRYPCTPNSSWAFLSASAWVSA